MTGFSYENNNGSYEITIGKGYTGDEEEIQKFAKEYWGTPKEIILYRGDGAGLKKVVSDLTSWMMHMGIEKYLPREVLTPNDKRAEDWQNRYQLLHIATHLATSNMKIKVK